MRKRLFAPGAIDGTESSRCHVTCMSRVDMHLAFESLSRPGFGRFYALVSEGPAAAVYESLAEVAKQNSMTLL